MKQKDYFPTEEAAPEIGTTYNNLKQSRVTGILFGVPAPKYIKLGRKVVYKKSTLDAWLSQFEEQGSTSEGAQ